MDVNVSSTVTEKGSSATSFANNYLNVGMSAIAFAFADMSDQALKRMLEFTEHELPLLNKEQNEVAKSISSLSKEAIPSNVTNAVDMSAFEKIQGEISAENNEGSIISQKINGGVSLDVTQPSKQMRALGGIGNVLMHDFISYAQVRNGR